MVTSSTTTTTTNATTNATRGAASGFESLEYETRIESLAVHGDVPPWLQGMLLRTGPAKWEMGERTMSHWFDGFAMLHRAVREPAYMHSFGLTERWLVLAEFPLVVNPIELALSGRPFIENFRWKPELGTRLHLFDRRTGKAHGPFETEARFGFHHVNAYEEDGDVVADICTYEDASIVEDLYLERLRSGWRRLV
jgi:carotenoid cleavage dioxygenase-like enzyme